MFFFYICVRVIFINLQLEDDVLPGIRYGLLSDKCGVVITSTCSEYYVVKLKVEVTSSKPDS